MNASQNALPLSGSSAGFPAPARLGHVLVIDNYDSFTWNLVHLIAPFADNIRVERNDAIGLNDISPEAFDAIILSPGPCAPNQAGICLDVVRQKSIDIPVFGVCLGLQSIGQAFGGNVGRAPVPMHGKTTLVLHRGTGIFAGIENSFRVARYHSLIVDRATCPTDLEVTAESEDGLIMALAHRVRPIHSVQFHPESIATEHGAQLMNNFFRLADGWNKQHRNRPTR